MGTLLFGDGPHRNDPFATSRARYAYKPATEHETANRIHVPIAVGQIETEAVLDTGAPYCLLAPWLADAVGLVAESGLERVTMVVRGGRVTGWLERTAIRLLADEGDDLEVDAVVIVPDERGAAVMGDLPCFLGMRGCLEAIRFAIDSGEDVFYFGRQA